MSVESNVPSLVLIVIVIFGEKGACIFDNPADNGMRARYLPLDSVFPEQVSMNELSLQRRVRNLNLQQVHTPVSNKPALGAGNHTDKWSIPRSVQGFIATICDIPCGEIGKVTSALWETRVWVCSSCVVHGMRTWPLLGNGCQMAV